MATINRKPYELRLINDYQFDEVASALQKCVRRNLEYEACYWAFVIHESGYHKYVWKRLLIIASEDVGNANPEAAILTRALYGNYTAAITAANRTKNDALVFIFQAIIYLCRSPKTREADSLVNLIRVRHEQGELLEVPEFAIDFHTRRGREQLGNWQDGTQNEIDHRHRLWFDKFSSIEPDTGDDRYVADLRELEGSRVMTYLAVISTPTIFDSLDITDNTKQDYLSRLPKFIGWLQRNGIDRDTLLQYKHYLRSRSDLGIASKNKYLAVARIALKELHRRGKLSVDITANVKSFQQSQMHKVAGLTEQEVTTLCAYARNQADGLQSNRLKALLALLIFQGLRQIEICRLDVADVNLTTGRLYVLGKGRDDKEPIYLHPQTVTALTTYLRRSKVKHGALFTSLWGQDKGTRLTTRGLRHIIKQAMTEAGIDKTVHGFRHYFTTTLIDNYQSDLLRVAKYTRHRSTDMLMVYNDTKIDRADLGRYYAAFGKLSI